MSAHVFDMGQTTEPDEEMVETCRSNLGFTPVSRSRNEGGSAQVEAWMSWRRELERDGE